MADRDPTPEEIEAAWAKLNAELEKGMADIRAGRVSPAEEVFDRLEAHFRNLPPKKIKGVGKR
jgi:predicted transcriptional regulator